MSIFTMTLIGANIVTFTDMLLLTKRKFVVVADNL